MNVQSLMSGPPKVGTAVKKPALKTKAAPSKTVKKAAPPPPKKAPPPPPKKKAPVRKAKGAVPVPDSPFVAIGDKFPLLGTPGATKLESKAPTEMNKAKVPTYEKRTPQRIKADLTKWYGPNRKLYLPNGLLTTADVPSYLDGSLAGDYGFDPLGLGKNKEQVAVYREYELIHARWAMLGVAGCFFPDALGVPGAFWQETGKTYLEGGTLSWSAPPFISVENPLPLPAIVAVQVVLMGAAENFRASGEGPPGFAPRFGEFESSAFSGKDKINPGGPLDFLGLASDPEEFEILKVREIKNGRLAMVSMLAFLFQGIVTHEGPCTNWAKHVVDPFGYNLITILSNGDSRTPTL